MGNDLHEADGQRRCGSTSGSVAPQGHRLPASLSTMRYAVVLRFDRTGTCPLILHNDSEPLTGGDEGRYRFVAETDDHAEAVAVADLLRRRINAGEL
jgi:hypothetical protein